MANRIQKKTFKDEKVNEEFIKRKAFLKREHELFDIEMNSRVRVHSTEIKYQLAKTLKTAFPYGYFDFADNEGFRFYIDKDLGEHHDAYISIPSNAPYAEIKVLLLENITYFAYEFDKIKPWVPFSKFFNRRYRNLVQSWLSAYCNHNFSSHDLEMIYWTIQEPLNHRLATDYVNSNFRSYHIERPYKKIMRAYEEEQAKERARRQKERLQRQAERLERIELQKAHKERMRAIREV